MIHASIPVAFLQNFGLPELLVILAIVLLFVGAKRLPEIARAMGQTIQEFKKGVKAVERDVNETKKS